eukprot:1173182-Heterocapsa_arctica.AAC.1
MVKSSSISLAKRLISNNGVEPDSHGNIVQTYAYDCGDEQNKLSVCFGATSQKWCAQPNHYDLLHPIDEEGKKEKHFR